MTFLLPILPRLLAVLAVAGALWYGWSVVNGWCNESCRDAREEVVSLQAKVTDLESQAQAARDRATALALLWAKELDNVKERIKERVIVRTQTFGGIRERVGKISDGVAIPVDVDTQRLLADVTRAANDSAPAAGSEVAPDPVPEATGSVDTQLRDWVAFAAAAGEAYRSAADQHLACVQAYTALERGAKAE